MTEMSERIKEIEQQIEQALWDLEARDEIEKALEIYQNAESKLAALDLTLKDTAYAEQQRVLAYCLMRQGNVLRQMDKPEEALALSERELAAARASGDEIMLARSLMSNGTNYIITGKIEKGLALTQQACALFENGDSYDHQQGLGWYWVLQSDLANAGIITRQPSEIIATAGRALEVLEPIENWPGVARAYAARARAYESTGNQAEAAKDRKKQQYYESKVESE
jgi:tetratricopeptide (TPR) repeat protein